MERHSEPWRRGGGSARAPANQGGDPPNACHTPGAPLTLSPAGQPGDAFQAQHLLREESPAPLWVVPRPRLPGPLGLVRFCLCRGLCSVGSSAEGEPSGLTSNHCSERTGTQRGPGDGGRRAVLSPGCPPWASRLAAPAVEGEAGQGGSSLRPRPWSNRARLRTSGLHCPPPAPTGPCGSADANLMSARPLVFLLLSIHRLCEPPLQPFPLGRTLGPPSFRL